MKLYLDIPYKRVNAHDLIMGSCYTIEEELVQCKVYKFERVKQNLPHAYHYYAFIKFSELDKKYQDIITEHYPWKVTEDGLYKVMVRRNDNKEFKPKDVEWGGLLGIPKEKNENQNK